jgi:hypothetical protein
MSPFDIVGYDVWLLVGCHLLQDTDIMSLSLTISLDEPKSLYCMIIHNYWVFRNKEAILKNMVCDRTLWCNLILVANPTWWDKAWLLY